MAELPDLYPFKALQNVEPDADALLQVVCPMVSSSSLQSLSRAEYGFEEEKYLKSLREIRDRQVVPVPLTRFPREVLLLASDYHSSADDVGMIETTFANAVLLRAENDEPGLWGSKTRLVSNLTAAVLTQPPHVQKALVEFLAFSIRSLEFVDDDRPHFAFALLTAAAVVNGELFPETSVFELADWVVAEEQRTRLYHPNRPSAWLLGDSAPFELTWKVVARALLVASERFASELRQYVTLLVEEASGSE